MNEAQFPEFVHKEIHPRPRLPIISASISAILWKHLLRLGFLPVAGERSEESEPAVSRSIEKLVDQILLDSNVPRKHVDTKRSEEHVQRGAQRSSRFFNNE